MPDSSSGTARRSKRAAAGVVGQLGEGVAQAARAHVVDREDRVGRALLPTVVDDLLRTALDLGIAALHRVEVELGCVGARGHRARGAAAHADAHAGPAELDQQRAGRELDLLRLRGVDAAKAARDHDGLVVAALHRVDVARHGLLVFAEVAQQIGPAELVVECGAAQRALGHDLQRAGNVLGLAVVALFRPELRHRETGQAGLGLGAAAGGAFVADLAARAGRGARERRNGGRMVVRLDLHQHMAQRAIFLIALRIRSRNEALDRRALHHRGVVGIGDHRVLRVLFLGVTDHREQALRLGLAVDGKAGIEDLVAAVLAVGLREHHQLDVARVASEPGEGFDQVVDLVFRQRQAKTRVGRHQRGAAPALHVDQRHRLGRQLAEKAGGLLDRGQHRFGHAVVQRDGHGGQQVAFEHGRLADQRGLELQVVLGDALDPAQRQAAVVGDVGGLGGPGRDGAQARRDDHRGARLGRRLEGLAVSQERGKALAAGRIERRVGDHQVHETGADALDARIDRLQLRQQLPRAEIAECAAALEKGYDGEGLRCGLRHGRMEASGAALEIKKSGRMAADWGHPRKP